MPDLVLIISPSLTPEGGLTLCVPRLALACGAVQRRAALAFHELQTGQSDARLLALLSTHRLLEDFPCDPLKER
jgi:hypothetical protein